MRVIIAGSRDGVSQADVDEAMWRAAEAGIEPTVVVSGGARGADFYGEQWARARGITVERHEANWELHGRAAGPIRNEEMAKVADALVAVWDGRSPGTRDMINRARHKQLRTIVYRL